MSRRTKRTFVGAVPPAHGAARSSAAITRARAAAVLVGVPVFLFVADFLRLSLGFAGNLGGLFAWTSAR